MKNHQYIACDLGAESGRVMLGTLGDEQLAVEEVHRFPNGPISILGSLRWDILRIFDELKTGLRKASARGASPSSLSCDSWGVDYVLLRRDEPMVGLPYHYRDSRTDGAFGRAIAIASEKEVFEETGIQFMPINTLYQLHHDLEKRPAILAAAERFLLMGDYFNFLFSGVPKAEESLASTTQLYNPLTRKWSSALINKFGFPMGIFPEVVPSGTVLGPLLPAVAAETQLTGAQVIAGCSHDTGAAVAAVPAAGEDWAFISSGTWSLLGIETSTPVIDAKSMEYNFTNELGYHRSVRFLKNINGLWILQECRRAWAQAGQEYSYEELTRLAEKSKGLKTFIDPRNPSFLKPDNMPEKIAEYCSRKGQPIPMAPSEVARCVLESLALLYRITLDRLKELTGQNISTLHIVGGGCKNQMLNQFAANATGCVVLAGPAECTAIGNLIIQAITLKHIASLESARRTVQRSFPISRYEPQDKQLWDQAYQRFQALCAD